LGSLCWSPDDRTIRAIVTDDPNTPFDEIQRPRYALLTVDGTAPSVEVEAPGMLTFGACSWQRLAP
jgi:hypothetical protein